MILVMDLDETMVFTRRKKQPKHNNYTTINVIYIFYMIYRFVELLLMYNLDHI